MLFCTTVDCDLRVSSVVTRSETLRALVDLFDAQGVSGHVTWFLNENDFAITHLHPEFLEQVIRRGDSIGVHDHVDFLGGAWEYEAIHDFCARSVGSVRHWLSRKGWFRPLAHRFGCCFQHLTAYRAIAELGYSICSDVCPGTRHHNHTGELSFDNSEVPVGVLPYWHTPEAINDYRINAGPIFQVPMMKATLTASFWPRLDRSVVDAWMAGAAKLVHETAVLTFCFHPYEIVNTERLRIDSGATARLGEMLTLMREEYGAAFVNVEECAAQFPPCSQTDCP